MKLLFEVIITGDFSRSPGEWTKRVQVNSVEEEKGGWVWGNKYYAFFRSKYELKPSSIITTVHGWYFIELC